ncbi:MAG: ABC transporter permease [Acidobacteria bacterium]|nr:ABC transporter permease [Acidobacteriota bacterium]MCA1636774.1 ABC transporter permease [Acidobacteriota bacterium]
MRFELKLALKYFRGRRKSLTRFTSLIALVGITAGVASLVLAQALARGFADEMRDKILANTAHVSVFSKDETEISNWLEFTENLKNTENVKEVLPATYESAIINSQDAATYAVLKVEGRELRVESQKPELLTATNTPSLIKNQTKENNEQQITNDKQIAISIGKQLAEKSNLKQGDAAEIIMLENQTGLKRTPVRVKKIFQTGLYEYDTTWIRIAPEDFARLKNQSKFAPTVLNVFVKDIYKANETANEIRQILGDRFKVIDWQEANQPLFAALSLERKVALAIISLIIFIAALNITTTLALLVNERRLDIAILRTCGATTRSFIFIFLFEGMLLGSLGIVFGAAIGFLGCFLGNHFRVVSLSAEVYSLNYIPFHTDLTNVLLIVSIALLLCLAATVYPAFKASRIKPLENLRTQ